MTLPEKALQQLTTFFNNEEIEKKIFKQLHGVLCYVPRFNNQSNTTTTDSDDPYGDGEKGHRYNTNPDNLWNIFDPLSLFGPPTYYLFGYEKFPIFSK